MSVHPVDPSCLIRSQQEDGGGWRPAQGWPLDCCDAACKSLLAVGLQDRHPGLKTFAEPVAVHRSGRRDHPTPPSDRHWVHLVQEPVHRQSTQIGALARWQHRVDERFRKRRTQLSLPAGTVRIEGWDRGANLGRTESRHRGGRWPQKRRRNREPGQA